MSQEPVPSTRRSDGPNPQQTIGQWILGASLFPDNDESPDHQGYIQSTGDVVEVTFARRDCIR